MVPFCETEKRRELSSEKNTFTMGFLLPEKVKGRKWGSLCSEIIFSVRSVLQVQIKRESVDQVTPITF